MSDDKSFKLGWVQILQFIAVILIIWAAVTLISGLQFAEVFPDDPDMGRAYPFEDTGIANYGTFAWVGGVVGVVLFVITLFVGKKDD
jgi:hypothetical protein